MATYKHGTYQSEVESDISLPVTLDYGYFIIGCAPIHKLTNKSINEVVRVGTYAEAISKFGGIQDLDFSISQAIKTAFTLYGVAPLYIVNIFDPDKHRKDTKTMLQNLTLKDGKVLIGNHKIITDTVVVKDNATSLEISDKTVVWTNDGLEIYAKPTSGQTIDVEFYEADLSKVKKTEAIGGYDTATMKRTGLELLDEVFLKHSELPAFVDIPDFSHESDVAAVMNTKASNINGGMFETMPLINAPVDITYDNVPSWKDSKNIKGENQLVLYGYIGLSGDIYYPSIHYACLSLSVDKKNDGMPSQTPSNYKYQMDGLYYKNNGKFEEIILDRETQANYLNKNGIITALNFKGWRCWGSETALNPNATDPKDKFSTTRRMFKYIGNELVISYFEKVDRKLTLKLAETITKSINLRLTSLVTTNHLIAASAELSKEDNDVLNVINGDITWLIKLGIAPGMKSLTFKKKYDSDALTQFASQLAG